MRFRLVCCAMVLAGAARAETPATVFDEDFKRERDRPNVKALRDWLRQEVALLDWSQWRRGLEDVR